MPDHPLQSILAAAAHGNFPPADGTVVIAGAPPGRCQAVAAFTGFHVIAAEAGENEIRGQLDPNDLGSPMETNFLTWLAERIGRRPGSFDQVLTTLGTGGSTALTPLDDSDHPRALRSLRYRDNVEVFLDGPGTIILGRGLAGRREVSIDLERPSRGRGLGTLLAVAARALTAEGEPLFAEVAPGNAVSIRAFLAAGYRPIGAEVLFPPA